MDHDGDDPGVAGHGLDEILSEVPHVATQQVDSRDFHLGLMSEDENADDGGAGVDGDEVGHQQRYAKVAEAHLLDIDDRGDHCSIDDGVHMYGRVGMYECGHQKQPGARHYVAD